VKAATVIATVNAEGLSVDATSSSAIDHASLTKKLLHRAEECRALAQMMTSADTAAYYLRLAETYDAMAEQADQLARDYRKNQN
jgi:hypothetical protein